jgi:hypothetical protein
MNGSLALLSSVIANPLISEELSQSNHAVHPGDSLEGIFNLSMLVPFKFRLSAIG